MTSTAPVAAAAAAAPTAAAPADSSQQNSFNPSWMRSTFNGGGTAAAPVRSPKTQDYPVAAPIFVKNRYGREDMLALMGEGAGHPPPEGLQNCPFYVEEALPPIVCYPLSDLEQRLQQNINSSKAMSSLSHAERASVATGAAYGGGGNDNVGGHKGGAGGWTPVKQWGRNHPNAAAPVKGGGPSRAYVPPCRNGARGDSTSNSQDQPQLTPFGQRFANRGRGGSQASTRGGGVTGAAFNSRAQGLYDPRDPKDRPRNRIRSTSDEGDGAGEGGWTPANVGKHGWTQNKDGGQQNAWTGGQGVHGTSANDGEDSRRKSESGPLPEWMEDGEDQDKEESGDEATSATGSFDEHGRFQKKHHVPAESTQPRKVPDVTQNKHERQLSSNSENQSVEKGPAVTQAPRDSHPSSTNVVNADADSSRSYSSLRPQGEPAGYHPSVPSQNPVVVPGPVPAAPPSMIHPPAPQFYYLDPTKQERGPFEKLQMESWYKRGFFTEGLEVRRSIDTKYRTLGELMQMNGRMTPFDYKDDVTSHPPVTAFSNSTQQYANLFASGGMWSDLAAPANMMYNQAAYDPIAAERKRIEEEQRRILEEQAKMREYQEQMVRELQKQREEHEKQLMEQRLALLKHQEEIERRERELKETAEETKARLEMERLALAEKARQIEEERAAKLKEEARKEEERRAEEAQRKRMEEELERQRIEREQLKRQQEAERERRAKEAAEEEARRAREAAEAAALEKARLQQQAENQRKQKAAEDNRRNVAAQEKAEKEKRQEPAKSFEIEEVWQAAPKPSSQHAGESGAKKTSTTKVAPWVAASAVQPVKEKTLKEIQEEEERQLRAEQAQQARLRKEHETVNLQASATWSNASQRLQWNQPAQQSPAAKTATVAKPAWGGAGVEPPKATSSPFWDSPPLQTANKPANNSAKKAEKGSNAKSSASKGGSNALANEKAAKRALGLGEDNSVFLEWVVQRLKELNSTVEADVLAMFIEGVENPDEVEDYVMGYLGDSKAVKEFVREFLLKRSDFRNRKQNAVKNDLSSARGAPESGNGAGFSAVQGKKKKNKGARLVVDGSCLGFRATSDPNRVNQGEIETVTLSSGQKR
nr:GYF domain containing protein [Haemonchus contortus]